MIRDTAVEPYKAARKIKPTRLSVSGFYCFRGERMVAYESTLERDLLRKLAYNSRVLDVFEQPTQLFWQSENGRSHRYTPDLLIEWRQLDEHWERRPLPWLIEVKPRAEIRRNWPKWHAKFLAATKLAQQEGWRFRIFDESRIHDNAFHNAVLLDRYNPREPLESIAYIQHAVHRSGVITIHETLESLFRSDYTRTKGLHDVYRLIAAGKLDCDLTTPLGEHTEIWARDDD